MKRIVNMRIDIITSTILKKSLDINAKKNPLKKNKQNAIILVCVSKHSNQYCPNKQTKIKASIKESIVNIKNK
jgi:hypothetical protein